MQRNKSREALLLKQNNIRQKYLQMAGAQQVLQGGRQDRDQLMEGAGQYQRRALPAQVR